MLDAVGDLYLAGGVVEGRFLGVRSGHALNIQLLRALFADESAWTLIDDDSVSDDWAEDWDDEAVLQATA
jgi:UDP-3-O-[3-hydroxymyristoyl] N-acetylglucosamine deacetylase